MRTLLARLRGRDEKMPDRVLDWSLLGPPPYALEPTQTIDTGGIVATVDYTSEWRTPAHSMSP
jgi:hypothetical protein